MTNKQKQEKFIYEAKQIFPNYDYSKVNFETTKTPVDIICPIHGLFKIKPEMITYYHSGCPECMKLIKSSKRIDTKTFIERAQKIFPNYDYSNVVYKTMKTKIDVVCNLHGLFKATPCNLLNGSGCPKCGNEKSGNKRKLSTNEFIKRVQQIHLNIDGTPKYDYSITEYNGLRNKIKYKCLKHGIIEQIAGNHINGEGCIFCIKKVQKMSTETFIEKIKELHPDKDFIFDKTVYTGHEEKVIIGCKKHGYFETIACNFINKGRNSDCPICSRERLNSQITSKKEKEVVEFIKSLFND